MFTGLVQKRGILTQLRREGGGFVARIEADAWDTPLVLGESVAVQGCCLTVCGIFPNGFEVDILEETYHCTAFPERSGKSVNLERALLPTDRLGGHLVQGHIDALATLVSRRQVGRDWCLRFSCGPEAARYIVYKGSIALDGTSLTVSAVPSDGEFEVCIIPTTWRETTLSDRKAGDTVHVETDLIGRYVEHFLQHPQKSGGSVTESLLRDAGFMES